MEFDPEEKEILNKALGCLGGVAIGDALGMPAEGLSPKEIAAGFGRIEGFEKPLKERPRISGAGCVTDDTLETLVVAECLIEHRRIKAEVMAEHLLAWVERIDALGSPLVGPSTKEGILRLLRREDPYESGKTGATIGAAARISPVGIVNIGKISECVEESAETCMPTHGTSLAISGASAVSCAVAKAMEGAGLDSIVEAAKVGARLGARYGYRHPSPPVEDRIESAIDIARGAATPAEACSRLYKEIGSGLSPAELVPSAIGILWATGGNFKEAVIHAANFGGDTDTLGAIVGAISGALNGFEAIPSDMFKFVVDRNSLDLRWYASELTKLALERLRL